MPTEAGGRVPTCWDNTRSSHSVFTGRPGTRLYEGALESTAGIHWFTLWRFIPKCVNLKPALPSLYYTDLKKNLNRQYTILNTKTVVTAYVDEQYVTRWRTSFSVLQHDLCFKSPWHDWDRWSTNTRNIEAKQETFSPHSVQRHCDWGRTSRTRSCCSFTHSEEEEEVPVQILKEDTAWPQDTVTQITAWEIVPLSRPGHWNAPNGSFLSCYLSLSVVLL